MTYRPKNFDHLHGTPGFSDALLKNHFTLYKGYVDNTNKFLEDMARLRKERKTGTPEYAGLKRRFAWEFNGIRLHELYFENIGKSRVELDRNSEFFGDLTEDFGSFEEWETDFRGVGGIRGIGWAMLCYEPLGGRMLNIWINEHDQGHLAGSTPLLIMDVFEHAYMTDYQTNRPEYIKNFFQVIDWRIVAGRYEEALRMEKQTVLSER